MADVSPHALIQSFVSGLSDFLTTLVQPGREETIPLYVYIPASSTVTWTPDLDYFVVGVVFDGAASSNITVTVDNSTFAQNHSSGVLKKGAVLATYGGTLSGTGVQRTRIYARQKVTFNQAAASASAVILYLVQA